MSNFNPKDPFGIARKHATKVTQWQNAWDDLNSGKYGDYTNPIYADVFGLGVTTSQGMRPYDRGYIQVLSGMLDKYVRSGRQSDEMDAYFRQQVIDYIRTLDQRAYDKDVLNEQRIYDTPINQLSRLFAAGISRDAGLQMLSGGAGGSGGAALIGSGIGAGTGADLVGTPGAQDLQESMLPWQKASTVFDGIGAICSLVGAGVNIAQAIPQIQIANATAELSQKQLEAFEGVNAVTQGMQSLAMTDEAFASAMKEWKNADDVIKYVASNPNSAFAQQVTSNGSFNTAFGTTYGREMFNRDWKQRLESRSAGDLFDEYVKQQRLETAIKECDVVNLSAELENINADTLVKDAQAQEALSRIVLNNAQTIMVGAQTDQFNAQTSLIELQSVAQGYTNENLRMEFELNSEGFPILKSYRLDELRLDLARMQALQNDSEAYRNAKNAFIDDANNQSAIKYASFIFNNASGTFAQEHPTLWKWAAGMHSCFAGELFQGVRETVKTGIDFVSALRGGK